MTARDTFSSPSPEEERFLQLLGAKWVAQALSTGAELGIFDALEPQAKPTEVLAKELGCQLEPLRRLLRVLAGEELIAEDLRGNFALTDVGKRFCEGRHGDLARYIGSPSQWHPWAYLADAIRTGRNAFELANGAPLFDYLSHHPDEAELYHTAVDAFTTAQASALSEMSLFAELGSVVDVGGGRGTLLRELLQRQPHLTGILFDLPEVVDASKQRLSETSLSQRLSFEGGSFFESLPNGHDCYIIKHVLHNWCDDRAQELLVRARRAVTKKGYIVVVDDLLIPGNRRDLSRYMDLEMLVVTGSGKERSKPEFRRLFSRARLGVEKTVRLTLSTWAFILRPKDAETQS